MKAVIFGINIVLLKVLKKEENPIKEERSLIKEENPIKKENIIKNSFLNIKYLIYNYIINMPKRFEVGDIIINNMGERYTINKLRPFNTPPAPPGTSPDSDDDVLAGYTYTLDDGHTINILINNIRDETGTMWTKYSVAQGIKRRKSNKRKKSNKNKKRSNKKTNKKRRNKK